ncbi:MAG: hypothetical protein HETSPECPRED_005169 [Heterodermia speciosa]|uniref:C2H2-type domain-containing protein n=1 Tax=Heterodermia speciosa TaxID=116794 RepID=A0A8H3PJX4_9LECA|nr:MAG: hypothetical protein HETSPECPRED_005169 [Heterodermia speciosa]
MAPQNDGQAITQSTEHSPEYYQQMKKSLNVLELTQRVYRKGSENMLSLVRRFWYQYCQFTEKDPVATLKNISINVLYAFFDWLLRERKNSLGATSSLQTYWNALCLVRQRLADAHSLRKDKKKKPVLHAEDEFELLKTLYTSTETIYPHERYRVQLALIMQLAGITGNRPSALLAVCYQHIKVTLLPDPDNREQPRVLIEIVFQHTKGYLGEKDANEFGIPDVPNEPCLLLCPHITMLALLFSDQAFAAPSLTSPERLFRLRIPPGQKQLLVPLKEEMAERPLFRRCKNTVKSIQISDEQALADSTLRPQMTNLGSITGMELPTGPYTFRRGNGQALDNSNEITDAQRNIILQHHNSSVFQNNYASRYMPDTQAAYRGLKPQTALMRAASGMSRTIDSRRPRKLSLAQQAEVDRYPDVRLLRRRLKSLLQTFQDQKRSITSAKGTPLYHHYRQAYRAHRSLRRRHEKALLTKVKERYKKEQPVIDIQRQLKGLPMAEQEALQTAEYVFEERVHAIDALFTFATSSTEEECQRRTTAINALIALCEKQENQGFRRSRADIKFKEKQASVSLPRKLSETLPIECKATQCIFCLGNEDLSAADRLKTFASRGDLKKHFHRKHLRHHPDGQPIACPHPRCDVILNGGMHLQNHAEVMHKTRT